MTNNRRAGGSIAGIKIGNARLSVILAGLSLALCASGTVAAAEDKSPPGAAQPASTQITLRRADLSSCAMPVYPQDDAKAGHTGTVDVSFLLNRDGLVLDSRVTRSSGYNSLDESVRQAFTKCRFSAVPETGPAEQWQPIRYIWTLD